MEEQDRKPVDPLKIAANAQIMLEAAGLAAQLKKAPIGYRIIDDVGHPHFISVEEYNRLKEEMEQYEAQQSLYYPPFETPSGIVTSTSSEHMKGIRETLGMEPAKPAYHPAAMAALAAMDNTAFPARMLTENTPDWISQHNTSEFERLMAAVAKEQAEEKALRQAIADEFDTKEPVPDFSEPSLRKKPVSSE
jgi:hypothetical protein